MRKVLRISLIALLLVFLVLVGYFFIGTAPQPEKISWGVNFSQKHAANLKLDWRENYLALLEDLGVKNLKIATHWDMLEPEEGKYYFPDLDWQIEKAQERQAKILLVLGRKTPRWPECHIPKWAETWTELEQQEQILKMLREIVSRYKNEEAIRAWQVENEPFFSFGICPKADKDFLKKEIDLVKSLDAKKRPVVISDSGEGSTWLEAAALSDILGITMYRKTHNRFFGVVNYPFPPVFYWRKAQIIKKIFNKDVFVGELQAEPWGKVLLYDSPLEEQRETMDLEQFKKNIEFAKKTGLKEFYLWGSEWWYWMKTTQSDSAIWQEAKKLFL